MGKTHQCCSVQDSVSPARPAEPAVQPSIAAIGILTIALLASCPHVLRAEETEAKAPFKPPKYHVRRQDENWSGLAGRAGEGGDFFDPIKHISLSDDGSIWAGFGGQVRERMEFWTNFNFGAPRADDDSDSFLLSRIFLHGDLHVGPHFRVFVEAKGAFATTRDLIGRRRGLDADDLAVQNGFLDFIVPIADKSKLTVRVGRHELLFGKQRLVSPLNWANTRRTFDGLSTILDLPDWKLTAFWTRPAPVQKYDFNETNHAQSLYGVYAAGKIPTTPIGLDLYWLGLNREGVAFNGTAGREDRHTMGGRVFGKIPDIGLDYDLEAAHQFGEIGHNDISAFMVASQLGFTFADCPARPRLYAGFDYATGDGDAGPANKVETFNQLFPLGHAYLGYIDAVGRQNNIDTSVGISCKPIKKLSVAITAHFFKRADDDDALYHAGGGVVRAGAAGSSRDVGSELDLLAEYKFNRHLLFLLGYSHFFPGDFIRETGPSDDIDFYYSAVQFTF